MWLKIVIELVLVKQEKIPVTCGFLDNVIERHASSSSFA